VLKIGIVFASKGEKGQLKQMIYSVSIEGWAGGGGGGHILELNCEKSNKIELKTNHFLLGGA